MRSKFGVMKNKNAESNDWWWNGRPSEFLMLFKPASRYQQRRTIQFTGQCKCPGAPKFASDSDVKTSCLHCLPCHYDYMLLVDLLVIALPQCFYNIDIREHLINGHGFPCAPLFKTTLEPASHFIRTPKSWQTTVYMYWFGLGFTKQMLEGMQNVTWQWHSAGLR